MSTNSDAARKYSRTHAERFQHELFEILRIPSISADPQFAGDQQRMAQWLVDHMHALGLSNTHKSCQPLALRSPTVNGWAPGKISPTVLVYGHYDVVPALMEDGWDTPPFEPVGQRRESLRPRRNRRQRAAVHPR